jgi:PAS domain S-box-containing protein
MDHIKPIAGVIDSVRDGEELARATLEAAADGILVVDRAGEIIGFNQRLLDLCGLPRSAFEGLHYKDALRSMCHLLDDPALCERRLEEIFARPEEPSYDLVCFKDGRVFERLSRPLWIAGRALGHVFSHRNVTDSVTAATALRDSEARKTAILDSALDAIVSMDHRGRIIEFNPAAEEMFGRSRDAAIGRELAELVIPPSLRGRHREGLPHYLAAGPGSMIGHRVELTAMRADGSEFPVEVSVLRIPCPGPPMFTGFIRDITARKQAEETIRQHAARLKALNDTSRILAEARLDLNAILGVATRRVAELFDDGCVLRLLSTDKAKLQTIAAHHVDPTVNELMKQILPRARGFIDEQGANAILRTGRPLFVVVTKEQARARLRPEFWPYLDRFPIHCWASAGMRVAGEVIGFLGVFRFRAAPPYSADDVEFLQDVADRVALAIHNARLYLAAEEAIRQRDDFILRASHELRTPLTPLKLQLDLFAHALQVGAIALSPHGRQLLELLETSGQNVSRLSRVVEEMLEVAQRTTGALDLAPDIDLSALVRQVVERHWREAEAARCPIEVSAAPGVRGCWDRVRIEQVVVNLLANALKYGASRPIRISVSAEDGDAKLVIRDFGIGIAEADQARIFSGFEHAASVRKFGGLGLGLHASRQIVEAHGGTISVESRVGEGAAFTIKLPLGDRADTRLETLSP